MAASPGMIPVRQLDEEFVAAANAVFGVLDLIGEEACSEQTRENLRIAREGAERCLSELGLERGDLRGLGTRADVVPLRRR